jgi:YrbI family 3-deoxy-D-manno-octulosonate 8-phosphate phosphatase
VSNKTVALIPVRGGSKSIPMKNVKLLAGRPLLHYALEAALLSERIDEVWVSSDSEAILKVAAELAHPKLKLLVRPAEFATDVASTESVMLDLAGREDFARMVLLQATSPLTTHQDLDAALALMSDSGADSLVTVTHEHRFRWTATGAGLATPDNYDPVRRPRRQEWSGDHYENGAFYVSSRELLLKTKSRLHGKVAAYVMPRATAIEIDEPGDWALLEALLTSRRKSPSPSLVAPLFEGGPLPRTTDTSQIRLIISDVDGVLTDGGMYYGASGEALKKFNTKDGLGIRKWLESGGDFAVVTGENSPSVHERIKKLRIEHYFPGVLDKAHVVRELIQKLGLTKDEVVYIGDDENDLPVVPEVGRFFCPADAVSSVKQAAATVTERRGGEGCVREVIEGLLPARS